MAKKAIKKTSKPATKPATKKVVKKVTKPSNPVRPGKSGQHHTPMKTKPAGVLTESTTTPAVVPPAAPPAPTTPAASVEASNPVTTSVASTEPAEPALPAAEKKPEGNYKDVYIEGAGNIKGAGNEDEDGDTFTLYYTDLKGQKRSSMLDAGDYASAKSEAASLLGIPESEIGDA